MRGKKNQDIASAVVAVGIVTCVVPEKDGAARPVQEGTTVTLTAPVAHSNLKGTKGQFK